MWRSGTTRGYSDAMPYRPAHASLDVRFGSVLSAILPAAVQASLIGSSMTGFYFLISANSFDPDTITQMILGPLAAILMYLFFGTIIGTIFCALCVGLVGVPIAVVLGARIEQSLAAWISMATAFTMTLFLVSGYGMFDGIDLWDDGFAQTFLAIFVYALPAAWLYRKAIIDARASSRWNGPAA